MSKMKLLITSILASAFVFLGGAIAPISVFAEESAETPEISVESVIDEEVITETESVENSAVFEQKTYVLERDGEKIELTLLSETKAEAVMYYYDAYYGTLALTYTYIESDVVELYNSDGSYVDVFRLHPNGYLIEYDDGVYIPPDIGDSENKETENITEKVEVTYEDILALMGSIAEKEGFGSEWEKTLYYIQTAASEKKVDTMIVLIVCVLVFLVIYSGVKVFRWYKKIKKDTTSKDIKDIKSASDDQTTAINGLIDEENKLVGKVDESTEREKALAKGIELQNVAIRCLIRGTNIKQDLKDEAFRALNESDDNCDKAKK
jgi:hypothetical protein